LRNSSLGKALASMAIPNVAIRVIIGSTNFCIVNFGNSGNLHLQSHCRDFTLQKLLAIDVRKSLNIKLDRFLNIGLRCLKRVSLALTAFQLRAIGIIAIAVFLNYGS
jgi:hypothetical protein